MKHPVDWISAQLTPNGSLSPNSRSLTSLVSPILMFLLLFPCFFSLAHLQLSSSLFSISPASSLCSHFSGSSRLLAAKRRAGWWTAWSTTVLIVPICCAAFLPRSFFAKCPMQNCQSPHSHLDFHERNIWSS